MKNRIRKVRADSGLSMEKFGERIGITKSSVSLLESGKNNPSEQTLKLICKEFKVNYDWLAVGEGEMYREIEDDTAEAVSDLLEEDNPFYNLILGIMKTYKKLDDKSQAALRNLSQELLDNLKKRD